MINIIIIMMMATIITTIMIIYNFTKTSKALLVFQQSAYTYKRYITYIKKNYKYTFGVNEILLSSGLIIIILNPEYILIGFIILLFFAYYNLRFYNLNSTRYSKKIPLNITNRLKRLVITYILINTIVIIVIILILLSLKITPYVMFFWYSLFIMLIILTYLIFPIIMLANLINTPMEKKIKNKFKKIAKIKLESYSKLITIGITGSYGKTSIKNIVGTILNEFEPTLITPESYNTPMGLTITIDKYLNKFHKYFIAEMGAYKKGEIKELVKLVHPKVGIVSAVGNQHLETFKTMNNILNTKLELIEGLPSDGLGILNLDNKYIREYKVKNNVDVQYYSLEDREADIFAFNIVYLENGMSFDVELNSIIYNIETKLLGKYNVENILAGILVAKYCGFEIEKIIKSVSKIQPVKNRLELKKISSDTIIIDDAFNANELGINEGIKILGNYKEYCRILITPGLIDLGTDSKKVHNELGKNLAKHCDVLYIVGKENREDIVHGIQQTDFNSNNVKKCDNFLEAYNEAILMSGKKVILIANDLPDKFNN